MPKNDRLDFDGIDIIEPDCYRILLVLLYNGIFNRPHYTEVLKDCDQGLDEE
jgi:hypothetical protein